MVHYFKLGMLVVALLFVSIGSALPQLRQGGDNGFSGFTIGGEQGPNFPFGGETTPNRTTGPDFPVTINITPDRPDPTPQTVPDQPLEPVEPLAVPLTQAQTPVDPRVVRRNIPYPIPRPVFREHPLPQVRPALTLGRAALNGAEYEPETIVLLVQTGEADDTIRALMQEYELAYIRANVLDLLDFNMVKFSLPDGQTVEQATRLLADDPRIIAIQPNYLFEIAQTSTPSDMRPMQYAPSKLHVAEAHELSTGQGVTVGVIDTAIDDMHPEMQDIDLRQSDVLGGNVVSRTHGTAMSGLIVAHSALDGVAPGVNLISIRAFDANTRGVVSSTSFALAQALDQMAGNGAQVLNLSFAGPRDPLVLKIMDRLEELDMPVIAAAGNNGPEASPVYPAAHRHAIAVTAIDDRDRGFAYANLGMYVEVSAPGVEILSPHPDGDYDLETGTSAATAHVTGIVALMLARNPELTVAQIRTILARSSLDLGAPGRDEVFGDGLINAALAVAAAGEAAL